uniref:Uncharacterized protein n=1 Tax=Siphoviridae sp. ctBLh2 TaxID=2827803 RepID=A0A8S5S3W5_9CAUD|nr:MAG TPA: hypothetical protein [Siphoviridae sp. ctBLh2]
MSCPGRSRSLRTGNSADTPTASWATRRRCLFFSCSIPHS